jgi:WD40 repeat protein
VLLWEKLKRRFLPFNAYELLVLSRPDYGATPSQPRTSLQVAIARRADASLAYLETEEKRAIARRIFLRLIQFGEGRPDTRRQQSVDDLRIAGDDLSLFDLTLRHLADCRLLTLSGEENTSKKVDIAHETLISGWPTLQQWIASRQEAEQTRRRLENKAQEWLKLNKKGGLLDIVELEEVKRWLATSDATELGYHQSLTDLVVASQSDIDEKDLEKTAQQQRELELIKEALDKERIAKEQAQRVKDEERRRKKLAQKAAIGAYIFSGIVLIVAGIAFMQYRTATIKNLETVIATSETLLATDNQIEALLTTVKAKSVLDRSFVWVNKTKEEFREHFWQLLLNIREVNRFQKHTDWVSSVSFSPTDGGNLIASASLDGTIQLWKLDSNQPFQTLQHHKVLSINFSPDGKFFASGGMDNILRIWKRKLDNKFEKFKEVPDGNWISLVTFNAKSDLIATAGADKTVKIFSQEGQLKNTCVGHKDQVMAVSFSPDGQKIASASKDKTVKIWDINCRLLKTLNNKSQVLTVRFLNNKTVALGGGDLDGNGQYNIIFWDWEKDQKIHELSGHSSQILYLNLNKEGNLMGSASEDGTVRIWNLNGTLLQTLKKHNGAVNEIDFSPDSQLVASAGKDKTVKIWKLKGILSQEIIDGVSFSFSPDLKKTIIASGGKDGTLYLWQQDNQSKSWQLNWKKKAHQEEIAKVSFSQDGQIIATVGMEKALDGWVKLWDIQGNLLYTSEKDSKIGSVSSLGFSHDRNVIILGYADGTIKRWRLNNTLQNTVDITELGRHDKLVTSISVSSDNIIASVSEDKTIKLWNLDGKQIDSFSGGDVFSAVSFSRDGQQIVAGNVDKKIYIFKRDGETFKPIKTAPFAGHEDTIRSVNFSLDGRFILSTSSNVYPTIKIWSREGKLILTLRPDQDSPSPEISFSSDGNFLTYSSSEGGIKIIKLNPLELTSLNFDGLIKVSCDWLTQYLIVNDTQNQGDCP